MDEDLHNLDSPDVVQHFNSLNLILFIPMQYSYNQSHSPTVHTVELQIVHKFKNSYMFWCYGAIVTKPQIKRHTSISTPLYLRLWRWHCGTETWEF